MDTLICITLPSYPMCILTWGIRHLWSDPPRNRTEWHHLAPMAHCEQVVKQDSPFAVRNWLGSYFLLSVVVAVAFVVAMVMVLYSTFMHGAVFPRTKKKKWTNAFPFQARIVVSYLLCIRSNKSIYQYYMISWMKIIKSHHPPCYTMTSITRIVFWTAHASHQVRYKQMQCCWGRVSAMLGYNHSYNNLGTNKSICIQSRKNNGGG